MCVSLCILLYPTNNIYFYTDWQEYEGVYVFATSEIEIKSENSQLVISRSDSTGSAILAYREPLKFQASKFVCVVNCLFMYYTYGLVCCRYHFLTTYSRA